MARRHRPGGRPSGRAQQRRRREKRARPGLDEGTAALPPPPAKRTETTPGISWLGLIGALMVFVPMAALGIEFLLDGRALAAVPLAMSAIYLPAIWASARTTARRRAVLRGVVAATIAMVFVSLPFLGPTLAVTLVPATALLAVASGLVFER